MYVKLRYFSLNALRNYSNIIWLNLYFIVIYIKFFLYDFFLICVKIGNFTYKLRIFKLTPLKNHHFIIK